jgi:hypothetical protein
MKLNPDFRAVAAVDVRAVESYAIKAPQPQLGELIAAGKGF